MIADNVRAPAFARNVHRRFGQVAAPVGTENVGRFDLMTESLNVGRDGRADILPFEPGRVALQAQELA